EPHAARVRVVAEPPPLHGERELLFLQAVELGTEIAASAIERGGLAVAILRGPLPPWLPVQRPAPPFEARVSIQPIAVWPEKRAEVAGAEVGQLIAIDQQRIAGGIGAHPIRRAIRARRAERQELPHGEAGGGEPVDERATAAPERGIERAEMEQ